MVHAVEVVRPTVRPLAQGDDACREQLHAKRDDPGGGACGTRQKSTGQLTIHGSVYVPGTSYRDRLGGVQPRTRTEGLEEIKITKKKRGGGHSPSVRAASGFWGHQHSTGRTSAGWTSVDRQLQSSLAYVVPEQGQDMYVLAEPRVPAYCGLHGRTEGADRQKDRLLFVQAARVPGCFFVVYLA